MDYLITTYFFPLYEPEILSQKYHIYLVNPATNEEIERAKLSLGNPENINSKAHNYKFLKSYQKVYYESLIRFKNKFSDYHFYIDEFFRGLNEKNVYEYIARMCVLVKLDDKSVKQDSDKEITKLLRDNKIKSEYFSAKKLLKSQKEIILNYVSLLSLLSNSEGNNYCGDNFILPSELNPLLSNNYYFIFYLQPFFLAAEKYKLDNNSYIDWKFLPTALDLFRPNSKKIDQLLMSKEQEKYLYIGNLIKSINISLTIDDRIKILILTSILELLLTHKPKNNSDDSISKQIQLKGSLLLYQNDKSNDIDSIKIELDNIYDIRSRIAHGDFDELKKMIKVGGKKYETLEDLYKDKVKQLFSYVRAIIEELIKDPKLVSFLKNN